MNVAAAEPTERSVGETGALAAPPDNGIARAREGLASLRQQLQDAAPGLGKELIDAVLEGVRSTKKARIAEECPKCGCNHHRWVTVPDAMERARALDLIMNQAEGRPSTAGDVSQTSQIVRRVGVSRS